VSGELALVAVQSRIELDCYQSPQAFTAFIDDLGAEAAAACAGAEHRLLVFPEGIGYFAPLVFAPAAARRRKKVNEALGILAATRPLSIIAGALRGQTLAPRAAVFHAVLPPADELMRTVFARLARRHRATVVAGSHLVVREHGRITNTSYTFAPDGHLVAVTDKNNLVPTLEDNGPGGLGLSRGDPARHPIVHTGWGELATLICYDGFCEPHTRNERFANMTPRVDAAGADVIANPAANSWAWDEGWVFAELGESILRRDQWRSEGLPASMTRLGHVRYGVTAHLCGQVMDQRFEGRSEVLAREPGAEAGSPNVVRVLARAQTIDQSEIVVARVAAPAAPAHESRVVG
jgi:predicted amidohydrolase